MPSWRLARGLSKLRQQINDKWPTRSKVSDGSIGDTAHSARVSDHNPDDRGIVCAIDITHDPANGPDGSLLSAALTRDLRTKYVIFAGRIWKARTGQWHPYTGPNAHRHHVHISILADRCDDESTWQLTTDIAPVAYPVLKLGARGQAVRQLQARLRANGFSIAVDGVLGKLTLAAVREFQRREKLPMLEEVDGATWAKLMEYH